MSKTIVSMLVLMCCLAFGIACSVNFDDPHDNPNNATAGGTSDSAKSSTEDFAREYDVKENNSIRISNSSGDIVIRGTDAKRVSVRGTKEGRDQDKLEIVDDSNDDSIDLSVRYNCRNCNASVKFEVAVPRGMRLRFDEIKTASGDVRIEGVTGSLETGTASGDIEIKDVTGKVSAEAASGNVSVADVDGEVNAETASGNVRVRIKRLVGDASMEYSSASGNVEVALPADTSANVKLSTVSGDVTTDFPLEVQRPQYGTGESAEGKIGNGGRNIRISAVSGDVKLTRL